MKKYFYHVLIGLTFSCQNADKTDSLFIHLGKEAIVNNALSISDLSIINLDSVLLLSDQLRPYMDENTRSIFVIDRNRIIYQYTINGQLLDSIGIQGEGPGEFFAATDLDFDEYGRLILYDNQGKSLHYFKLSNQQYDSTQAIGLFGNGYSYHDRKHIFYTNYFINQDLGQHTAAIYEAEGKLVDAFMEHPELKMSAGDISGFMLVDKAQNKPVYNQMFSDSLFVLAMHDRNTEKVIIMDFMANKWPYGFDVQKLMAPDAFDYSFLTGSNRSTFLHEGLLFTFIMGSKTKGVVGSFIIDLEKQKLYGVKEPIMKLIDRPFHADHQGFYYRLLTSEQIENIVNDKDVLNLVQRDFPSFYEQLLSFDEAKHNPMVLKYRLEINL